MLVILYIDLFNFLLQHLLLIVFQHFVSLLFHFCKLLCELSLFLGVALDILLEFSDLLFNLCEYLGPLLILILGEEELFAEELERQVLIAHVELIYLLLDCDLPLELDIHLDLHRLQLIAIILLRLRR